MKQELIYELYSEIILLLDDKDLSSALDKLSTFCQEIQDWQLQEEINEIRTSYEYMLDYMLRGIIDPKRHVLRNQLLVRAYTLNDRILLALNKTEGTGLFYDKFRMYEKTPSSPFQKLLMELEFFTHQLSELEQEQEKDTSTDRHELIDLSRRHEQAFTELFYATWASSFWSKSQQDDALQILQSGDVQPFVKAFLVTALTLGLLHHMDAYKFAVLIEAYHNPNIAVSQRALVGIALVCYEYDKRINVYPEIAYKLATLQEEVSFTAELRTIQLQLLYSRESKKTERKIKDELLPFFLRKSSEGADSFHILSEESLAEKMEKNPDWEEQLRNSGVEELLSEFQSMMMEGEDVFLASFAQVKNYPFFHELSNWLLPFTTTHSEIQRTIKGKEGLRILEVITQFSTLCDSDKYSFGLTIAGIPEMQKGMVLNQLFMQDDVFFEMSKQMEGDKGLAKRENSKHYIQDFYRFLNLNSRKREFDNFFQKDLYLFNCQTLQPALGNHKTKLSIAEFFFQKELWGESEVLYRTLITEQGGTADIYQKLGYSLQQQMEYQEAIEMYQKADLLKPGQRWVFKNIAFCHRQLREYKEALSYYEQMKIDTPGPNQMLSMQMGTCLLSMGRLNEAMNFFFEAEFIDEESPRPWRAIAWCSFLSGKIEQSQRYCRKLLQLPAPTKEDFLNAAHTEWALGNISEAVTLYKKSILGYGDIELFLQTLRNDRDHLVKQGILPDDIPLMADLLRSSHE